MSFADYLGAMFSAKPKPLYSYRPTNAGDIGAGTRDYAFQYPFQYPRQWFAGPGVTPFGIMRVWQGNPSYYQQTVTPAAAQGAGSLSDEARLMSLSPNFYATAENTAYF